MELFGILVLALIWGASFLFIKIGVEAGMSPVLVAFVRVGLGAALLWFVVAARVLFAPGSFRKPIPRERSTWGKLGFVGLLNNTLPFVLIAWGEQRISSGLASILNATMPLFTVLVAHFFTRDDRIGPLKAAGVLVGFAGAGLVILPGATDSMGGETSGSLAVVLASACYACATVFVKKNLTGATDPIATGASQLLMALAWLAPPTALTGAAVVLGELPAEAVLAVSALGLLGTGLAYLIYYMLIQRAKASQLSLVTYLLPVTALGWGALVLGEEITWYALAGLALIVAGIALVNRANASQ